MIDSYSFGSITIDGKHYSHDVIVFPDRVEANWWRQEGHGLYPADIDQVMEEKPDILIIGCGASSCLRVPPETKKYIESQGIKLITLPTSQACQEYNRLLKDQKRVVAGLHLTC